MAETIAANEKSKQLRLSLPNADGTQQVITILEQDEDATKPPRLLNVSNGPAPTAATPRHVLDRETHVILSIGSGHRLAAQVYKDVVAPILKAVYDEQQYPQLHVHETKSETHILELIEEQLFPTANKGTPLRIILASGDGGIVDFVNGLLAKPAGSNYVAPQVVLLPLGTANALYHSMNAGKDSTWGLNTLSSTTSKPLPVFTASFSPGARLLIDEARKEKELPKDPVTGHAIMYGAVVSSWGMHASLVADSDTTEYRKFGVERFKMAAKEALYPADGSSPHPYKAVVFVLQSDKWTQLPDQEHMYVLATLVSNLEQPFCISPETKPLDGSIHLVHFGPTSGDEAMRIMGLAYQGGKHIADPAVRYEAIDGLRIEFQGKEEDARWRRVCIDGKIVRVEKDGWVEIRKEERRVLEIVTA